MERIRYIGVDPDTTHTGVAIFFAGGGFRLMLVAAPKLGSAEERAPYMASALRRELGALFCDHGAVPEAEAAVEFQHHRPNDPRPASIMALQAVAGMAASAVSILVPAERIYTPIPFKWKGSVPKEIHHRRIMRELGIENQDDPRFHGIPKALRQHVLDAAGLALWLRRGRRIS